MFEQLLDETCAVITAKYKETRCSWNLRLINNTVTLKILSCKLSKLQEIVVSLINLASTLASVH